MGREKEEYLITEKPMKALLVFSLPMMLGNLFQQFYNMADSIIVGRFVGEMALSSVGASYALTSVFISLAVGGGAGASVITSNAFGERNYKKMKESISTNLLAFLLISVILACFGYFFSNDILTALNTPDNILTDAEIYLRIYFLGLPFLFMYNILSSVFNSIGKSRIPLFLLVFSSILNVALDIIAVAELDMGVAGAAWATLISQALSAIISFFILIRILRKMEGEMESCFSRPLFSQSFRIALPSILQQGTITVGMMLVQSVVNAFGSYVLAGYSAAIRVDNIVTVPFTAVGNSMSPYTAQNIGAGRKGRIREGYRSGLVIVFAFAMLSAAILFSFSHEIISLFLGSEGSAEAYRTGEEYLRFLSFFYFILGFAMTTGGVLRGCGKMKMFTLGSLINLSLRVIGSMAFAPVYGVSVVWYVVPAGWAVYFLLCLSAYRKETSAAFSHVFTEHAPEKETH